MLHDRTNGNVRTMHVTPGRNSFMTIPVLNNNQNTNEVYSVRIHDPDENLFTKPEMRLIGDQAELSHWVMQGKVQRPQAWNLITTHNDVILKPG